jgi:hypothetical protein
VFSAARGFLSRLFFPEELRGSEFRMANKVEWPQVVAVPRRITVQVMQEGQTIKHEVYGLGIVTSSDLERTAVDFDDHGPKLFVTSIMTAELIGEAPAVPPKTKRRRKASTAAKAAKKAEKAAAAAARS